MQNTGFRHWGDFEAMSYIDLKPTLAEWPYDADQVSVRKILGSDGEVRIQMRVELGVIQMECDGRPDGVCQHGCASLLAYHQARLAKHEERNGTPLGFVLSPHHCRELRYEASLYYRRYVAEFVLEEYSNVIRDTAHNLAIFDLCHEYATESEDRTCLEPFRPYVVMMNSRARAHEALEQDETTSALAHVNRGTMQIRACYENLGRPEAAETSEEMRMLRFLATEIEERIPGDSLIATRRALRDAIEQERFEDAARLRDELSSLYDSRKRTVEG